jgi:hypothetical protein
MDLKHFSMLGEVIHDSPDPVPLLGLPDTFRQPQQTALHGTAVVALAVGSLPLLATDPSSLAHDCENYRGIAQAGSAVFFDLSDQNDNRYAFRLPQGDFGEHVLAWVCSSLALH